MDKNLTDRAVEVGCSTRTSSSKGMVSIKQLEGLITCFEGVNGLSIMSKHKKPRLVVPILRW